MTLPLAERLTMPPPLDRRRFLLAAGGAAAIAAGCHPQKQMPTNWQPPAVKPLAGGPPEVPTAYPDDRPNVILVRFGGGVRRQETIAHPEKSYCPFILHELAGKHGVLFSNVEIANGPGIATSHAQGTLHLLTGEYRDHKDVAGRVYNQRFESPTPTLPEYLRKRYTDVGAHQALIVNGEDRLNEEFFTFSNHDHYGVNFRSLVLSLHGYKTYLLRRQLAEGRFGTGGARERAERQLEEMVSLDYRTRDVRHQVNPQLERFWGAWRGHYGEGGMSHPRGDRLLTTLTLWALKHLRPRFVLINYQDPDYVHWGPPHFYTRAVSIIDEGVREIYNAAQADEHYRDRTVFVVAPDCGRDSNRGAAVPFQHHFNSKSAHEIFAVVAGPKKFVPHGPGRVIDRLQQQISVAPTVGELMGFRAREADAESLFKVA